MKSLDVEKNVSKIKGAGEGAGKSGSFFFFTHDYKFVIKTMTKTDKTALIDSIDDYVEHIEDNPNSLLGRYYGMYEVITPYFEAVSIVLMGNVTQLKDRSKHTY